MREEEEEEEEEGEEEKGQPGQLHPLCWTER